jgi:hypothetical protein
VTRSAGWALERWTEVVLDSDVHLLIANLEPDSATCSKRCRLFDLPQAQDFAEEVARLVFATRRGAQPNVV